MCKIDKETLIHLFWECSVTKTFWGRVHRFLVSIHLIPASHVLDIYESLGFRREKDDILVSHCLLLARYYIYCCKFKNISPSIREYAQQLKYNLEIEKQISIVTDSQNKFQQKWDKILHALLFLYSLRTGSKCEPARRLYLIPLTVYCVLTVGK